jgi:hypothetical protein
LIEDCGNIVDLILMMFFLYYMVCSTFNICDYAKVNKYSNLLL